MSDDDNQEIKMKLTFAPGCFDGFEGTQEELDELVEIIKTKFEDGSLLSHSMSMQQIAEQHPELLQFVETLSDEEVADMLQAIEVMDAYPEINTTRH